MQTLILITLGLIVLYWFRSAERQKVKHLRVFSQKQQALLLQAGEELANKEEVISDLTDKYRNALGEQIRLTEIAQAGIETEIALRTRLGEQMEKTRASLETQLEILNAHKRTLIACN